MILLTFAFELSSFGLRPECVADMNSFWSFGQKLVGLGREVIDLFRKTKAFTVRVWLVMFDWSSLLPSPPT